MGVASAAADVAAVPRYRRSCRWTPSASPHDMIYQPFLQLPTLSFSSTSSLSSLSLSLSLCLSRARTRTPLPAAVAAPPCFSPSSFLHSLWSRTYTETSSSSLREERERELDKLPPLRDFFGCRLTTGLSPWKVVIGLDECHSSGLLVTTETWPWLCVSRPEQGLSFVSGTPGESRVESSSCENMVNPVFSKIVLHSSK